MTSSHLASASTSRSPSMDVVKSKARLRDFRPSRRAMIVAVARLAFLGLFLGFWQFAAGKPKQPHVLIDSFFVSQPTDIVDALHTWIKRGILFSNIRVTLRETLMGFLLGAGAGLVAGFILGSSKWLSQIFHPFITALNSIPRLALVPLFIIWFGLGTASKVALVTTIVFFLIFYNTYEGVRDVDDELINVLKVMRASRLQLYLKVTLPSAMSWIIAGLRMSVPYALVAAVTAEMISSNQGMGYLITRSSGQFYTAGVFAGIVVLMALALILTGLIAVLELWLLRWKPRRLDRH